MAIIFDEKSRSFAINTANTTYAMFVTEEYNLLTHLYYGERISDGASLTYLRHNSGVGRSMTYPEVTYDDYEQKGHAKFCPHALRQEYSVFGRGDFRTPCLVGRFDDGSRTIDLRYHSYKILNGKPVLEGLPSVYLNDGEKAETLVITLKDTAFELYVELYYSIIEGHDQIMRSTRIINKTGKDFFIESALTMNLDIHKKEFDAITFYGMQNAERSVERTPLRHGKISVDSTLGGTGHFSNNSIILCDNNADEDHGECIGATLVYSGNFAITAELDHVGRTRLSMGINPVGFCWKLEDGESFTTPEVIMSYSATGLATLSHGFHDIIRYNVCRGKWKDARRPVLINNWEATVFDFDEDKLVEIATDAKKFGVEMLVVDDGWFGHRDWDNTSLGDWYIDKKKLPNGMEGLCKRLNDMDVELGVWFEPENISEESDLYKEHPDYCIRVPARDPMKSRWQLTLDLTRKEIRDNIFEQMKKVISSCPIRYIKWDMNRNITDAYSRELPVDRQGEFYHRYILGVYDLMERIVEEFPDLLIENCNGGGGRFDAGMLYYSPQIWCSDNTDPAHRFKIQYGTSMIYPVSTMGAHIAYAPNINTFHHTSVFTRGVTAMAGTFGYELDPMHETETTIKEMALMSELYKKHYFTINHGDYYRIFSPYDRSTVQTRLSAWEFVSKDKNKALYSMVQMDNVNSGGDLYVKLKGLDPNKTYKLHMYYETRHDKIKPFTPWIEDKDFGEYTGEVLMKAGLHLNLFRGDSMATLIEIDAI